jgi:hypothetical protein
MKRVIKTSVFPAGKSEVFSRLQKLKMLQYVAYPYATFAPVDGNNDMKWKAGRTLAFHFRLFGLIPFGIHEIKVIRFGIEEGIFTIERNRHVPVWNHEIILEELPDGNCRYTDIVDIDAGRKTFFVCLWAKRFYAHRQRKWVRMLGGAGKNRR